MQRCGPKGVLADYLEHAIEVAQARGRNGATGEGLDPKHQCRDPQSVIATTVALATARQVGAKWIATCRGRSRDNGKRNSC